MLIQFNPKNFKSFGDEVSLDSSATEITEHEDHVVELANDKLPKVMAIYGANTSGESNIYDAFKFVSYYVEESFKFGGENDSRQKTDSDYIRVNPFLSDSKSRGMESISEMFFADNSENTGKIYQYGFVLQSDEAVKGWSYFEAKTTRDRYKITFYRKRGEEPEVNGLPKSGIRNIKVALRKEILIISLGAKLKVSKLRKVRGWFLNNEVVSSGNPAENFSRSQVLPKDFITSREVQSNAVNYFASFDNTICDLKARGVQWETERESDPSHKIDALYRVADCDGLGSILLKSESSGTLKMFALYLSLKEVFDNGGTLFVDELDVRLHPLLVRNIILIFLSPEINTDHAQMIFTIYGIRQLSNGLLRRDEIWPMDKNQDGVSGLYFPADFKSKNRDKVRHDGALVRNYPMGSYSAISVLRPMEMLKGRGVDDE